jgi:type II secretory pathway component PulM
MRAFLQLPVRTQKLLVTSVVGLCFLLGAVLSWQAHRNLAAARSALSGTGAQVQAMQALVARYQQLQGADTTGAAVSDLIAVVNSSLEGKRFQPSRIQQVAAGELSVRLDAVPFNDALAWLLELENTGAVVPGVVGITQNQPAGVNMTLTLHGN